MTKTRFNRRHLIIGATATLWTPALARAQSVLPLAEPTAPVDRDGQEPVRRNATSFVTQRWQDHFDDLGKAAIVADTVSRALHFWGEDGTYKLYPSSVPLTEDLTRRGRTKVVRKVEGPSWRPTPAMRKRNPEWPEYVGPGPDNPLGTHALYLSWTYYRIHGTHDTRKIGRRSSNGCIGLYNEHIAELFSLTKVGTQVLLI